MPHEILRIKNDDHHFNYWWPTLRLCRKCFYDYKTFHFKPEFRNGDQTYWQNLCKLKKKFHQEKIILFLVWENWQKSVWIGIKEHMQFCLTNDFLLKNISHDLLTFTVEGKEIIFDVAKVWKTVEICFLEKGYIYL